MRHPALIGSAVGLLLVLAPRLAAEGDRDEEAKAVAALKRASERFGIQTEKTSRGPVVVGVGISLEDVSDETLAHLQHFKHLRVVNLLSAREVRDSALASLKGLTKLEEVLLPYSIGDEGLKHLRDLPRLRRLVCFQSRVTDAGLAHLRGLKALEVLDLGGARGVTDEGLAHLRGLTALRELNLERTRVSGKGLAHMEGMSRLRALNLQHTPLTQEGFKHLPPTTRLRLVNVSETGATVPAGQKPEGEFRLRWRKTVAQLHDADTGKPVGAKLRPLAEWEGREWLSLGIRGEAVSPDGKFVAFGAGYEHREKISGKGTNVGAVRVYDTATGERVASYPWRIGSVRALVFLADGRTVAFKVDRHEVDGP